MPINIPTKKEGDKLTANEFNQLVSTVRTLEVAEPSGETITQSARVVTAFGNLKVGDNLQGMSIVDVIIKAFCTGADTPPIPSTGKFIFLHLSDTHGHYLETMQKAVDLAKADNSISYILHTGDVLMHQAMAEVVNTSPVPFLLMPGNHDAVDHGYTQSVLRVNLVDNFQSLNNVTCPISGSSLWYKDFLFESRTIRVIAMDEYEHERVGAPVGSKHGVVYSQTQIDWFIDCLKNTPSSYYVIIAHHQPVSNIRVPNTGKFISENAPLFYEFESKEAGSEPTLIPRIVDAYQNKQRISDYITPSGSSGINLTVNADFTACTPANFLFHIGGHTHWDVVEYLPSYPRQLQIIIDEAETNKYTYSDLARNEANDSAYLLNKVTLDFNTRTIKLERIGAHVTDSGATRDSIEFPFVKGEVPVTSVTLNKSTLSLDQGSTETLVATVLPTDATNKVVSWVSSNTTLATVDSNGFVTALQPGNCTITATVGGKSAVCSLTVVAVPVTVESINIVPESLNIKDTETLKIEVEITPSNANTPIVFTSSNETVAIVVNGNLVGVSAGTCTITASADGHSDTVAVTVTHQIVEVTSIALNVSEIIVSPSSVYQLIATVLPANAEDKTVSWVSSNPTVATVDNNGLVTYISDGSCTITATAGGKSATATCTASAFDPELLAFKTRVTADGGTFFNEAGLSETIALHTEILGTKPRLDFLAYKESGGVVTKLYSYDGTFDVTSVTDVIVAGNGLAVKTGSTFGKINWTGALWNHHLTTLFYDGTVIEQSRKETVFVDNILIYSGAYVNKNSSSNDGTVSTLFWQGKKLHTQANWVNGKEDTLTRAYTAESVESVLLEVEDSDTYVKRIKINGVDGVYSPPNIDYWSSGLSIKTAFIKIYQGFKLFIAG